ncbi:7874_t:CDS:2 [Funneliformis mosseae]|uniref:7874_t:CDS:1 n=1 Tax=Funneliformis mosseae TaxID=27381 RepID=A0A9N8Z503_FUNMO|nr:7874_t:CDS:2 [Funneliformis mosseae]
MTLFEYNKPTAVNSFFNLCYRDLADIAFNREIQRLRITGNPGIGKTLFSYYLLYLLANEKKTIIYDNNATNGLIVFDKEEVFYIDDKSVIRQYQSNPEVWYIVYGKEPKRVDAKIVCSPRKDHYRNFDKYIGTTIRESIVEELFFQWGGIPQFVLEKVYDESQQKVLNYIGESDHMSHKLLHIYTNVPIDDIEDENDKGVESGDDVDDEEIEAAGIGLTKKLQDVLMNKLRNELNASLSDGISNPLLGSTFGQFSHRILQNGGNFRVRLLDHASTTSTSFYINMPRQDKKLMFSTIDTIEYSKYYQPMNQNFESIDAIVAPDKLFQITIAKNHPIKLNGLKKLIDKLGGKSGMGDIFFYFVLPKNLYMNYRTQPFYTSKKTVAKAKPHWVKDRVKQYALEIDLSSYANITV